MSGVPNLSDEFCVWFSQTPWGPWGHKTVIYKIPREEGVLFYLGHIHNRPESEHTGVYTLSCSLYPFGGYVPQQLADKGTYLPIYMKANLKALSPYSTSVPSLKAESQIKLYPNPVVDELYLEGVSDPVSVQVFDLAGVLVTEENSTTIDMSSFKSGIYFVRLEETTLKVVKK
jgi:hypothetical protein